MEQKQRIIDFCKFASSADDALFASKIADYIELDNFARYMAITTWLSDLDGILGPGQNYYLYLQPKTQKFAFIPWDQDQAFGQFPRGTEEARENLSIQKPWSGENRFLARVFKVEAFKKAYLQRMEEFSNGIFQPERIQKQVDELANILRAPLLEESPEKLAEMNKAASGQKVSILMGPGFAGPIMTKPIKPFVEARSKSVKDQLAGKSEGQAINPGFGRPR
jgi:spore coat protein H